MTPADDMLEALRRLVEAESFSDDPEGIERCAEVIDELCRDLLGSGTLPAGQHRVWRREGERPVLLLCHFDTVWPPGTLATFPFEVSDGIARGPGTFDMKAGIVQCLWALRDVPDGPVTILFTADEETGSLSSRPLIEDEARGARAVLVLEPAAGQKIKVARKGVAHWRIRIAGKAAHAGLSLDEGVNAALELAHQIRALEGIARPEEGTTLTVTMVGGGSAENVVPESAWCAVDGRMWTAAEGERLEREVAGLQPVLPGASISVSGGVNRGPMERGAAEALATRLKALGHDVGEAAVGGASDGNFTAALGVPTLDGLGPVGGGAHARGEHIVIDEMPRRAAMVTDLLRDLLKDG